MELNINITTSDNCEVVIQDQSNYLEEDFKGIVKNRFKHSETVSISVLKLNKVTENIVKDYTISKHTEQYISLPVKFDGWFTVEYIVIPTKKWFESELQKIEGSALNLYSIIYFADESTIYKYVDGTVYAIPLDEILEINPINTTISKTSKDYVSICFLRKCYINLCLLIFNSRGFSSCWNKNDIDSELIYKRDLAWMAINVIKYLTECEQLYEVERIIEVLQGCNGLCPQKSITSKTSGCGCSK